MVGRPPDLGDSCSSSSGLPDGVNAPGYAGLDGWLPDPSAKPDRPPRQQDRLRPHRRDNAAPSSPWMPSAWPSR